MLMNWWCYKRIGGGYWVKQKRIAAGNLVGFASQNRFNSHNYNDKGRSCCLCHCGNTAKHNHGDAIASPWFPNVNLLSQAIKYTFSPDYNMNKMYALIVIVSTIVIMWCESDLGVGDCYMCWGLLWYSGSFTNRLSCLVNNSAQAFQWPETEFRLIFCWKGVPWARAL